MSTAKIEQLRSYFNGLDTSQKKEFIGNLQQKLKEKNNAEYSRFLDDCTKKYNTEISRTMPDYPDNASVAHKQIKSTTAQNHIENQNENGKTNNGAASVLNVLAFIELMCSLLGAAGYFTAYHPNPAVALMIVFGGIVTAIFICSYADTIQILHDIRNNTRKK